MRLHLFAAMLATVCLADGQDVEVDKAGLLREFTPAEAKVLDKPYEGSIRRVWPKVGAENEAELKPESVRLNVMRPADGDQGHSPIDTPYLATSEDGSSYWGAFALKPKLPETGKLTSFASYQEIVDSLGAPTHLPIGGETDEKWAHDMVSWRLFTPSDPDSIEIVEVSVFRKSPLGDARDGKYVIESYSVSRGTLTRGGGAGADFAGEAEGKAAAKVNDELFPEGVETTRWAWGSGGELTLHRDGSAKHSTWGKPGTWRRGANEAVILISDDGLGFEIKFDANGIGNVRSVAGNATTTIVRKKQE